MAPLGDLPRYEIDQAIDDAGGTLAGQVTVAWTNRTGSPVAGLPFRLHPNAPAELGISAESGLAVTEVATLDGPPSTWTTVRPTLVRVDFATPVAPGRRIRLALRYTGRLRPLPPSVNDAMAQALGSMGSLTTVGAADYGLLASGDGLVTVASAYPMIAPFRDGGFDTAPPGRVGDLAYNEVAAFRLRTVVPAGVSLVTSLVDAEPAALPDGNTVVVSEGVGVRDVALVAGRDLGRQSVQVGPTRVTSVFRTRDARAGARALVVAAAALDSYERRLGPYPYTELDVVEASLTGGAGGVEFPGLVLVAGMLYREPGAMPTGPLAGLGGLLGGLGAPLGAGPPGSGAAPPSPRLPTDLLDGLLDFTVAHEVAHQYFAGLVGSDSLRHPALDEPLAQYLAGLAIEDLRGREAATAAMDRNVKVNYALYRLLGGPDRAAARDVATFRSRVEYAGLVYGKAPYLYTHLRATLGDDRLHAALRSAVEAHRFRLVTLDGWLATLEAAAGPGSGVRAAARRWLEEAHGDTDLGVDDSGDFVMAAILPPELLAVLKSLAPLGITPRSLLQTIAGGTLADDGPVGPGLDPESALRSLGPLGGRAAPPPSATPTAPRP